MTRGYLSAAIERLSGEGSQRLIFASITIIKVIGETR
jgi:hypothetical protein